MAAVTRSSAPDAGPWQERLIRIDLPEGLHARPAGRFVSLLAAFEATVEVRNHTTGAGPANGRSLTSLATLGVLRGQMVLVRVRGRDGNEALVAIEALATRGFDEGASPPLPPTPALAGLGSPRDAIVGQPAARGSVVAPARRVHRRPTGRTREIGGPGQEAVVLRRAIDAVRDELRRTRDAIASQAGAVHAEILSTQIMILDDDALAGPAFAALGDDGVPAEAAWATATGAVAARYRALPDPYQRARATDIDEIGRLVIARMAGAADPPALWGPGVLIADDLGPAETAALDLNLVRGIATAGGGPTSHTAILASALGIPAVVGLGPGILTIVEGTPVLLDGDAGTLTIDPDPATLATSGPTPSAAPHIRPVEPAAGDSERRLALEVSANISLLIEMRALQASSADAIGLLRTEMLFLDRTTMPTREEQHAAFAAICDEAEGRRVTIRTLDSGFDKPLAFLPEPVTANPALGVRGLRRTLAEPGLLAAHVGAILRVAAEHPVRIMFPMISTLGEWRRARDVVESEIDALGWSERRPHGLQIGAMIEVPAAAICAELFAPEVDFFSIGTNDLAQYVMAADRTNSATSALADALHPAVLRLIGEVCGAADAHGRWVGVCGEVAGDPLATPVLVGLGVNGLSVAPGLVDDIKRLAERFDVDEARTLAAEAVSLGSADEVRERARTFLKGTH